MISMAAEYALRAVLCLARQAQEPLTTHQIAEIAHVPAGYLAKVLQVLARAGIVSSQRGVNGGFALVPAPRSLTMMDVVRAVDASKRIEGCPLGLHHGGLCSLHRHLDEVAAHAEQVLGAITIEQLLAESPLCPAQHHEPRDKP